MTAAEFVLARIAEWEAIAQDAAPKPTGRWSWVTVPNLTSAETRHIATHDPARVLAQCARLRQIVELHGDHHECSTYDHNGELDNCTWVVDPDRECSTLQLLAAIWSDHPDYDEAWQV